MIKSKIGLLFLGISSVALFLWFNYTNNTFAQEGPDSQYDFFINNFDSQIDVQENGDLKIQEKITTTFNQAKHGIYRRIPYQYLQSGDKLRTPISNISVDNQEYTSYREGDNMIIRIGSEDVILPSWTTVTYNINYEVGGGIRWYTGYQELYRNIIWNDRDVPIQTSQFHINLPVLFTKTDTNRFAYFGDYWSRNILSTVQFQEKNIEGSEINGLKPHQGITVGLKFPDNTFILPKMNPILQFLFNYIFYLIPLCLFLYLYRLWKKYGKDHPLPDVVQYYAPDHLTPPEIKAFYSRNISPNDMVSLLYKRAAAGLITIEKKEGWFLSSDDYLVHKLKDIFEDTETKDFEKIMFDSIFATEDSVNISDRKDLYKVLEAGANSVYAKYSQAANYTPESKSAFWKTLLIVIFMPISLFVLLIILLWITIYILSLSVDLNIMNDVGYTLDAVIDTHFGSIILIILLTIAMGIFFLSIIYAKTSEYEILLSKIRGYKTFLQKVEKPKLQTLLREDPNFIDKALPYAVVLWVAGIFLKIANEVLESWYHPSWFIGNALWSNIVKDIGKIESAKWTSPPAPSGGGSFWWSGWFSSGWGGFSGGGWGWWGWGSR